MESVTSTRTPGSALRQRLLADAVRGNVYAPDCPSRALLDHVTTRWGVLVLSLLLDRPHRFGELASSVSGLSDKMLSQTLKTLVADGFVDRFVEDGPPVRVTYRLSDVGLEVATRVADLVEWLEENVGALEAAKAARGVQPSART
jgi:DNA-binding HxlR family transcriptional regulator